MRIILIPLHHPFYFMPLVFSPGRANLIGEHTDYTGGYVLPFALPLGNYFLSFPSEGDFEVFSHLYGKDSFSLDKIKKTGTWRDYFRGPILELSRNRNLKAIKIEVFGNLPPGSGLSSSASIELGVILSTCLLNCFKLSRREMALIAKKSENDFVGVPCGIMDQFAISMGRRGNLMFLDCESLKSEYVRFPREYIFLIFYSGKSRHLTSGRYSNLRSEILLALKKLKKNTSKEISSQDSKRLRGRLRKVAEYLARENERVKKARDLLKSEEMGELASLLYEAHFDASRSLGTGTEEIDFFVSISRSLGALGARFTGAGFGGSALAIFSKEKIWDTIEEIKRKFMRKFDAVPRCWACAPCQGLQILEEQEIFQNFAISQRLK